MEKIIHQIWVGHYDIPEREKYFIDNVKKLNSSFQHILWTDDNLPELPEKINTLCTAFRKQKDYAHVADVLRIFLIKEYGGLYIDVDFKPLKPFDLYDNNTSDLFVCYHGGNDYTMPNGVFGGKKNSEQVNFVYDLVDIEKGGWYGPSWLGGAVKKYLNLDYETNHEIVKMECIKHNIDYCLFSVFEQYFQHLALYSWSPENKRNFENGNINYLKWTK